MISVPDPLQLDLSRWILGVVLAGAVAVAGHRTRSLTPHGAFAATIVGGSIVGSGGWWTGLLLVAFFVSSSALSRIRPRGMPIADQVMQVRQARGDERDAVQVVANGGIPVICAVVGWLMASPEPWLLAAASAIAGATADTWATEIGRHSGTPPRSIITRNPVPPGTSGAVSALGTTGSITGAVLIAAIAALGAAADVWAHAATLPVLIVVGFSGVIGSLLDSLLGATVQGIWWCPACNPYTESAVHQCGTTTRLQRGISFMDNDLVNAISIAGAGMSGLVLAFVWT